MSLPGLEQFKQHADDLFEIGFNEDQSLPCRIEEVKSVLQIPGQPENEQFSVVFACGDQQVYEQGVYAISHDTLGQFELFLVPVFGDDKGVHYEAIFT